MDRETVTAQWYAAYEHKTGHDRNDLRTNRGVLFQQMACEMSMVRAFRDILQDPATSDVLNVGCGSGMDIHLLILVGYDQSRMTGIDILAERIELAKNQYPRVNFQNGDASKMESPNDSFDLVFESKMFATLPDDAVSNPIASEMVRVCKPGGYIMLIDWRTPKPHDTSYKALTKKRVIDMFGVGTTTQLVSIHNGALIPPLGRFLSAHMPGAYFLVSSLMPYLVGQVTYVLRKK